MAQSVSSRSSRDQRASAAWGSVACSEAARVTCLSQAGRQTRWRRWCAVSRVDEVAVRAAIGLRRKTATSILARRRRADRAECRPARDRAARRFRRGSTRLNGGPPGSRPPKDQARAGSVVGFSGGACRASARFPTSIGVVVLGFISSKDRLSRSRIAPLPDSLTQTVPTARRRSPPGRSRGSSSYRRASGRPRRSSGRRPPPAPWAVGYPPQRRMTEACMVPPCR
jgi:hypothetical protein